jgi:hypothetical protein
MILYHDIHQILNKGHLRLLYQVTQAPGLLLLYPPRNQLQILCAARVENHLPGLLLVVLPRLDQKLVLKLLFIDIRRLNSQLDQYFEGLPNDLVMNDLTISLAFYLTEYDFLVGLQNVRVFEDGLLEEELAALSDTLELLLDDVVLVKIHGDVTYHAQTEHVVLPELVKLGQEVLSVTILEGVLKRQDVPLDAFCYLFVQELSILVDDERVGISVELLEGQL